MNSTEPNHKTLIAHLAHVLTRVDGRVTAADDTSFLEWLNVTVADAARAADQHEALKRIIRELRVSLEARYDLAAVQVILSSFAFLLNKKYAPLAHVCAGNSPTCKRRVV